jgi:hypothetical protein
MNGDAGDEAEVAGDRGVRGAVEEATTPREASFRFLASGCELNKADPPGTLSSAWIPRYTKPSPPSCPGPAQGARPPQQTLPGSPLPLQPQSRQGRRHALQGSLPRPTVEEPSSSAGASWEWPDLRPALFLLSSLHERSRDGSGSQMGCTRCHGGRGDQGRK